MPTWNELISGKTPQQVFAELLAAFDGLTPPIQTADWGPTSSIRQLLGKGVSPVIARVFAAVADTTKGHHLRLAQRLAEERGAADWEARSEDSFLVLLARQRYGVEPHAPLYTEGLLRFTAVPGAGPYNIAGGQFWASTDGGLRYVTSNSATILLPKGGTVDVPIRAEAAGSKYSLVSVGQIDTANGRGALNVSLPGVTVELAAQPNGTWITAYGSDKETPKELADRCATRMAAIGQDGGRGAVTAPTDMLVYRAKTAHPQVKKVRVFTNYYKGRARPGVATVFVAGETGPLSQAVVDAVAVSLAPFRSPNGQLYVESCEEFPLSPQGVVWVESERYGRAAIDQIGTNLALYARRAEIGAPILAAQIFEEVMQPAGVVDFKPSGLADARLKPHQVPVFKTNGLVYDTIPAR